MNAEPASVPSVPAVILTVSGPRPSKLETIGVMMLINGILNVIYNSFGALVILFSVLTGGLASFGLGCLCLPIVILPVLPLVLGVFEIVYGSRAMSSTSSPVSYGTLQTVAILEIVCIATGNVISLVIGILNLVFLSDPSVKSYYNRV